MTKIVQLVNSCKDCPNRHYYSGGTYECMKVQPSRLNADMSIPEWCPLTDHRANEPVRELCEALGWQGGTFHQVLAEVKRLRAHGVAASNRGVSAHQTPIPSPMDYEGEG